MELYVEKSFIDDFYITVDFENLSKAQKIVINIFKEYGDVDKYMDVEINSLDDIETLKFENEVIAYLFTYNVPEGISSIKDHFFKYSKCEQTLIFMQKQHIWFQDAENKGALCFSLDNLEFKIANIIKKCHFKINLNFPFYNWSSLSSLKILPTNEMFISDLYIVIGDSWDKNIYKNLIPFLKSVLNDNVTNIRTLIFTQKIGPGRAENYCEKEKAIKICTLLDTIFAEYNTYFQIVSTNHYKNIDLHDRIILSNFFAIDIGIGFNKLIPWKKSNSQIIVETIFEKYTYTRLNNLKKDYSNYYMELQKKTKNNNFKYYPE